MPFFAWLMFRLTSHWKQFRISGSSRIGNDLPVQAHPALDNSSSCARRRKRVDWFPEGELRMSDRNFEALVDRARRIEMTPPEKEAQRSSFAYGNANIENSAVTREVVDKAATALAAEKGAPSRSPGR